MQPYLTERVERFVPEIARFIQEEALPLEEKLRQEGFGAILPLLAEKRQQVKALAYGRLICRAIWAAWACP